MLFSVRALTADNRLTQFQLEAPDEGEARREVQRRQCRAVEVKQANGGGLPTLGRARFALTLFAQELLALLTAGLSLVEAIEALAYKQSTAADETVLLNVHRALRNGQRFSSALQAHPEVFPGMLIALVQAAEGTSDLPLALKRYVDYRQRADEIRHKLISAAIYPAILFVVGSCVALFLVGYVVPRFASVYRGTGRTLPWLSQVMIDGGRWISLHSGLVAVSGGVLVAIAVGVAWEISRRQAWLDWMLRLPAIGPRVALVSLSRQYLTLGMLLQGGIALSHALQILIDGAGGSLRDSLQRALLRVRAGESLSTALEANGLTTPISLRLLRVGERTGGLGTMLTRAAEFYEGDISRFIDRFSRAAEPVMMAAIGLVVGAIVVMLYMPIFDLAGSLR
jgi:general secretion pathway protein F